MLVVGKAVDTYDVSLVDEELRNGVEADSFWCLSRLLDGIQDNYTFAQPGIQTRVSQLRELVTRIDGGSMMHNYAHHQKKKKKKLCIKKKKKKFLAFVQFILSSIYLYPVVINIENYNNYLVIFNNFWMTKVNLIILIFHCIHDTMLIGYLRSCF